MEKHQVTKDVNAVILTGIRTIRPVSKNDIPLGSGRRSGMGLSSLQVIKDFNVALDRICKEGINPYEIAQEIDMASAEIVNQKKKRKTFTQSFRVALKSAVKKHGLQGKLDITESNHGERFYVIGRGE